MDTDTTTNGAAEGWEGDLNPLDDDDERQAIFAALDSFRQYRKKAHYNCTHRRRQNLYALPSEQWRMLAAPPFSLLDNLNTVDDAIDTNADLAEEILELGLQAFGVPTSPTKQGPFNWHNTATVNDIAKAHSTVRQFYRDWSAEGSVERASSTAVILADLHANLQPNSRHVLVPGAGLARLVLDLTINGYDTTGNEISYHQLLASNWILNQMSNAGQYSLFPFATTFTNLRNRHQQLKEVKIPDIHPATAIAERLRIGATVGEMNMHAGDFVTTYTSSEHKEAFDAVVSVFFIDTAPNLIKYIDAVRNCLVEEGIWANVGPLLWHFDDRNVKEPDKNRHRAASLQMDADRGIAEPGSFELTNAEVLLLLSQTGFEVIKHEMIDSTPGLGYIQDPESMLQNLYQCSHWVARKVKAQA